MDIRVITVVRNEEYMLPFFLDHYARFASRIYLLDDHSTDLTREITCAISHYAPIVVLDFPFRRGLNESDISRAYEMYVRDINHGSRADWVMFPDCDELIHADGLTDILTAARILHCPVIRCQGYTMASKTPPPPYAGVPLTTLLNLGVRERRYDKPIIVDPSTTFTIGPGRHTINIDPKLQIFTPGPKLLHYCYLGRDYIRNRINRNFDRMLDLTDEARETQRQYRLDRAMSSYDRAMRLRTKVI